MRLATLVLALALIATLVVRLTQGADVSRAAPPAAPRPGEVAPSVELDDAEGRRVSVGGPDRGFTLLTFYRAAGTPW